MARWLSGTALVSVPANPAANRVMLASLAIDRVELDRLEDYWPLDLIPNTRKWIVENLRTGSLNQVELNMRLEQRPVANKGEKGEKGEKGGHWIAVKTDGSLGFIGATIHMNPQLPPALNASGSVKFTDHEVTVALQRAEVGGLEITPSVVSLTNLKSENPRLKVKVNAQGSLANTVQLLAAPGLHVAQSIGITAEQALAGQVKANVELEFPLSPHAPDYGTPPLYHVVGRITGMRFERLIGNWSAEDSDLRLEVDNQKLTIGGLLKVEGLELNPEVEMSFDPRSTTFLVSAVPWSPI